MKPIITLAVLAVGTIAAAVAVAIKKKNEEYEFDCCCDECCEDDLIDPDQTKEEAVEDKE